MNLSGYRVIVDGMNLCCNANPVSLYPMWTLHSALLRAGFVAPNIDWMFDASFRHRLGDSEYRLFERGLKGKLWRQAPKDVPADWIIFIQMNNDTELFVVSNDAYDKEKDLERRPNDLSDRHLRYSLSRKDMDLIFPSERQ